jgi:hypothetical protein
VDIGTRGVDRPVYLAFLKGEMTVKVVYGEPELIGSGMCQDESGDHAVTLRFPRRVKRAGGYADALHPTMVTIRIDGMSQLMDGDVLSVVLHARKEG